VNNLKKTIDPEQITAIIDTREQTPVDLKPLKSVRGTLATADYSIIGLEHIVAIERKSLADLIACIGRERERFEKEVHRLLAYPVRCLVVEACWPDIEQQRYRGQVHPNAAIGSLLGWIAAGLPVIMAGDHHAAGRYISRLLYTAARRRWQENAHFLLSISEEVS
jgi:DNA excision repair protein ERCC-4